MTDFVETLAVGPDRWQLPIVGGEVTQVRIDYAFGLMIDTFGDADPMTVMLRINTPFTFHSSTSSITVDPEHTAAAGALATLHKAVVVDAIAMRTGDLVVRFADGSAIEVPPHDQYEAWEVHGGPPRCAETFYFMSAPGRGVVPIYRVDE